MPRNSPFANSEFSQVQFWTVDEAAEGQRIDNYLRLHLKGVPKSRIYRILRKGEVRVNKKRVKPEYKLIPGDQVRIPPIQYEEKSTPEVSAHLEIVKQLEERILYESERVIVINKPALMAVHGGSGLNFGVIEALRALRPEAPFLELVHRLDRETSGCLVIAKKRSALRRLHEQLRLKTMQKTYLALVKGRWPKKLLEVHAPLLKVQHASGERNVVVSPEGKESHTRFALERRIAGYSLIQAEPVTGRTHQIRVHAQHAGFPLIGDAKYGIEEENLKFDAAGLNRLFLHAAAIRFRETDSRQVTAVEAPMDQDLVATLKWLSD